MDVLDSLGRKHVEVGGNTFTLENTIPFEVWLSKQGIRHDDFDKLTLKDKERIILRWKWGLSDEANEDLEGTERYILGTMDTDDMSRLPADWQFYYKSKLEFNKRVIEIKNKYGVVFVQHKDLDQNAQRLKTIFDAEMVQ